MNSHPKSVTSPPAGGGATWEKVSDPEVPDLKRSGCAYLHLDPERGKGPRRGLYPELPPSSVSRFRFFLRVNLCRSSCSLTLFLSLFRPVCKWKRPRRESFRPLPLRQARGCFQETPPDLDTVCRAAEIRTRDLRSPRSMHPKALTCANTRKPPLACRLIDHWFALVRVVSRRLAASTRPEEKRYSMITPAASSTSLSAERPRMYLPRVPASHA